MANLEDEIVDVKSSLYGEFNVYNLLGAMSVASCLGIDSQTLTHAVRKIKAVKGRFSVLHTDKGTIIVDYAHTPEAFENALTEEENDPEEDEEPSDDE